MVAIDFQIPYDIFMSEGQKPASKDIKGQYASTLGSLRQEKDRLGIKEMPDSSVIINAAGEGEGRPLGAKLPIYDTPNLGVGENDMPKHVLNLESLVPGWKPPRQKPNSGKK